VSSDVVQILGFLGVAFILALVLMFADKEQPDCAPDKEDGPVIIDEDELE
jgi:hypothetical protein